MQTVSQTVDEFLREKETMRSPYKPSPEIDYLTPTVSLLELPSGCCPFPFPDLQCCGRPKAFGKNYCQHHYSLMYQPGKTKAQAAIEHQ